MHASRVRFALRCSLACTNTYLFPLPCLSHACRLAVAAAFHGDGRFVRHLGADHLHAPRGVACASNGDVLVCDAHLHAVLVFRALGHAPLRMFGDSLVHGAGRF